MKAKPSTPEMIFKSAPCQKCHKKKANMMICTKCLRAYFCDMVTFSYYNFFPIPRLFLYSPSSGVAWIFTANFSHHLMPRRVKREMTCLSLVT